MHTRIAHNINKCVSAICIIRLMMYSLYSYTVKVEILAHTVCKIIYNSYQTCSYSIQNNMKELQVCWSAMAIIAWVMSHAVLIVYREL